MKLTWQDHVLIHACGVFLADTVTTDRDGMIQSILVEVLPDMTGDNPTLADFIKAAWEFVSLPALGLRAAQACRSGILSDYHMRRMAAAWDKIRKH